jgi:conjugative relaxase-like TrwC/TraI family protein
MLRINQNNHAGGAKSYYSTADYYTECQELTGQWRGKASAMLGLEGTIAKPDWDAMCDRISPITGETLFQRQTAQRTVGYDFNFHVPKSVSALYALTQDDRILEAFQASVDTTMGDIEAEMQTRVRKEGKNEDRLTGNMIWGEFVHFTSRPVDGVPDPHLHAHCFVQNVTWDNQEQSWKAGQFRGLVRDAPYYEAMFHARLSRKLAEMGLPVERTEKGWEIAGVPRTVLEKFSRRTAEIEEKARELGIEDAEAKDELGAKTRSHKVANLSMPALRAEWLSRLTPDEQDAIASVEKLLGGESRPNEEKAASRAVNFAIAHEFERKSVVPERMLLATALKQAVGQSSADEVRRAMAAKELLVHERQGRRMATTRDVLDEESRIIAYARNGRGTRRPLGRKNRPLKREWLNASQRTAVEHVLSSSDSVIMVRGAAGVGKTSLMQEAVEAIQEGGTKVLAFAPTAEASRTVLREAGFAEADTVARLLKDETLQRKAQGQVIWIDEAGLLGAKTMAQVFELAERIDARILLTGDKRQHGSVERGAMLRLLETQAGIKTAEVTEIQRQRDHYKSAVKALSEGRTEEGFDRLDELGWIRELPDEKRHRQLAVDYVDATTHGKSALAVSPTHAEADRITAEIRRLLKEQGRLGDDSRRFITLQNAQLTEAQRSDALHYREGDVLQFHQNAKGFRRGERVAVAGQPLPLDQADRFSLFHVSSVELAPGDLIRITNNGISLDGKRLNNGALYRLHHFDEHGNLVLNNGWKIGKDYGHIAHGYVVTSHASQGKTVDRVFVGQGSLSAVASSREQFYVSCSRAKESVTVYCDDKEALREAVVQSDERLSATELTHADRIRATVDLQRRYDVLARPQAAEIRVHEPGKTRQQELVHER